LRQRRRARLPLNVSTVPTPGRASSCVRNAAGAVLLSLYTINTRNVVPTETSVVFTS
jgi:hypothetical protein